MTADLVAFLRARLDEDEAIAKAATPGPWTVDDETLAEAIHGPEHQDVVSGGRWGGEATVFDTDDAVHIARHDPARVLADVEAKRRIVNERPWPIGRNWDQVRAWHDTTLRLLALPYACHPDYREEWKP